MIKCPNCGSTAQVKENKTLWHEDGWTVHRIGKYQCGCGLHFWGLATFVCQDAYEELFLEQNKDE